MSVQLKFRRGTAAQWTSSNPTLAAGELGIETDTNRFKIGNGSTAWNSLAYGGLQGATGPAGPTGATGVGATGATGLGATGATGITALQGTMTGNITASGFIINGLEYNEAIFSLGTTSGTITPDVANGNVQQITLNGNLTLNAFANPVAGQSLTLIITTNGTNRTLTSTMLFAGGSKTLSTTSTRDIITVFYDGTNYFATLAKDFK